MIYLHKALLDNNIELSPKIQRIELQVSDLQLKLRLQLIVALSRLELDRRCTTNRAIRRTGTSKNRSNRKQGFKCKMMQEVWRVMDHSRIRIEDTLP